MGRLRRPIDDGDWNLAFLFPHEIVEARERLGLVILPLAPIEWHGPHLVLGCDPLLAHAFARRLARELACPYFPPLFIGTERERRPETLRALIEVQKNNSGPLSLLTVEMEDPHGFGRILRDEEGRVTAIVEEAVATPEQRAIRELNTGVYCIRNEWLWGALRKIQRSPKGEYYLTDLVEIAVSEGLEVQAVCLADSEEALGINTRVHLAEAEAVLRKRIARQWMEAGVTIVDPASTYIEADVTIGMDTVIYPNTYLRGQTRIGENCVLGPDTIIEDSQIGNHCTVLASVIESSVLEDEVRMGPFCHLRPKAHLARGVKMGNFGEVKASYLGPGVHMGHFSYIGEAPLPATLTGKTSTALKLAKMLLSAQTPCW